ncbi:MAG: acyl-CoA dehydrogenase family protein [Alphaproteobacteria bacterium]|nr:acyl-CoA dehydrogenase family protein [Alphaproteobacteria bacterium]MCB9796782.1 acyl-CoA dehydrogenase family protein [Alphaproteobacteria bacterium]
MMFQLSEDTQQIRDLARDFARSEVIPGAAERDRTHEFPAELAAALGEMGFMGMFVPEEYGGAGMGVLDYVVALEEISYADASVGVVMSVNNSLTIYPILAFGTEAQKHKYLPDLASGQKIGCYALTEPSAGSDAAAQKTKVSKLPDGSYQLDGTKMWITNGPQANTCVAYASMDPAMRHKAVCAFILETDWEGFRVGKVEEKLGIRSSHTSELIFEGLRVPAENLLGEENHGFKVAMGTLDGGRIGIAAQALGIAQRAFDLAVAYSQERVAFGKPIATKQAIQWMIADMGTRIEAARLLTWKAAVLKDRGERASRECSMAKLYASETANFCADRALQIHGGYGYSQEYEVERLFRDARITTLYEGTSEIQRLVIAKSFLG